MTIANIDTGTNHRREQLPDHSPDRRSRPAGRKALHHRLNLPPNLHLLVVGLPLVPSKMGPLLAIPSLRLRLLPPRSCPLRIHRIRQRMGAKRRDRLLRHGLLERCLLLLPEFWQRR